MLIKQYLQGALFAGLTLALGMGLGLLSTKSLERHTTRSRAQLLGLESKLEQISNIKNGDFNHDGLYPDYRAKFKDGHYQVFYHNGFTQQ